MIYISLWLINLLLVSDQHKVAEVKKFENPSPPIIQNTIPQNNRSIFQNKLNTIPQNNRSIFQDKLNTIPQNNRSIFQDKLENLKKSTPYTIHIGSNLNSKQLFSYFSFFSESNYKETICIIRKTILLIYM